MREIVFNDPDTPRNTTVRTMDMIVNATITSNKLNPRDLTLIPHSPVFGFNNARRMVDGQVKPSSAGIRQIDGIRSDDLAGLQENDHQRILSSRDLDATRHREKPVNLVTLE